MKEQKPEPFFTRFLEEQEQEHELEVQTDVKAGWPYHTMKYPSDNDDWETS